MVLLHEPEQAAEIADFRGTDFFLIGKTAADDDTEIQEQELIHAVPPRHIAGLFQLHPGEDLFTFLKPVIGECEPIAEPEFLFESGVIFKEDAVSGRIDEIAVSAFPFIFMENDIGNPEISQIFVFVEIAERDKECITPADRIGSVFGYMGSFSGPNDNNFIEFMMMPMVIESSAVINGITIHIQPMQKSV